MDDVALTKLVLTELGRIPGWEWRETGPAYTSAEVGLFYGQIGTSPDRAVGVRVYGGTDQYLEHYRYRRLQLRIRGAARRPGGADELAWLAELVLSNLSRVGGILGAGRESFSPSGTDGNGRSERTDNYIINLDNQEAQP